MATDVVVQADEVSVDSERRERGRVTARFRVRFKTVDDLVTTYTQDISQGGLFLASKTFLPVGTVCQIQLELPESDDPASIIARVTYVLSEEQAMAQKRKPGMGLEFLDTGGKKVAERIGAYLADRLGTLDGGDGEEMVAATVLVVDDFEPYRKRVAEVLERRGHQVRFASNGLDALALAIREPPDVVLSDVQMPTMDGWQLLRMVRGRPTLAHLPILFLTTLSGEEDRLRGYQLGVDDYIPKPFEDRELVARVERMVRRARRQSAGARRNALRGDLSQVGLASVLSFIHIERRTGLLIVIRGLDIATLHIKAGDVYQVDLPPAHASLVGMDRVFEVLSWTSGSFELSSGEVTVDNTVGHATSFILMEHARRTDERAQHGA